MSREVAVYLSRLSKAALLDVVVDLAALVEGVESAELTQHQVWVLVEPRMAIRRFDGGVE